MADERNPDGSDPTGSWGTPEGDVPRPAEPAQPAEPEPATGGSDAAGDVSTAASEATARAAATLADLRGAPRSVFIGAIAIAVIGLIGGVLNAWPVTWTAVILVLLGAAAAAVVWLGAGGSNVLPFAGRYVDLVTGLVATVVGAGGIVEAVFDLDQIGESDLIVATVLYVALAAAGLFVLLATGRAWPGGVGAIAKPVRPGAERGGRLAFGGILLVILGWLVNVTVGVWSWYAASLVVFLILVVAVILLMISDDAFGLRIPVPAAWIAAGVAIWAGLIAFIEHVQYFVSQDRFDPGIEDWLGMIIYMVGIVLVIAGTVMMAANARPAVDAEPAGPPDASSPPSGDESGPTGTGSGPGSTGAGSTGW